MGKLVKIQYATTDLTSTNDTLPTVAFVHTGKTIRMMHFFNFVVD
jgi:hypothetical protein